MLKLISRFVLEVLPYVLLILAAAALLPGVADSLMAATLPTSFSSLPQDCGKMPEPYGFGRGQTALEWIRQDHEAFAPNLFRHEIAKAAQDNLAKR